MRLHQPEEQETEKINASHIVWPRSCCSHTQETVGETYEGLAQKLESIASPSGRP